jgi:EAL domain-containing protein (putative c-di-GMP-specific phosphodiesterase class I)
MRVTAEGVETERQAQLVRALSCDFIQGFHFGRPLPETELAARILQAALGRDGGRTEPTAQAGAA